MTPKKKKIYLAIIAVCLMFSAGILIWSNSSSDEPIAGHSFNPLPSGSTSAPLLDPNNIIDYSVVGYPVPAVFPAIDEFDTKVLESSQFQKLQDYPPLDTAGLLGRDNPFKSY